MRHYPRDQLHFTILLGQQKIADFKLPDSRTVTLPLTTSLTDDFIRVIATAVDTGARIGSVSIPQHIVLSGGLATYTQWITLFEYDDDDDYDGAMGLNDEEEPRVLLRMTCDNPQSGTSRRSQG